MKQRTKLLRTLLVILMAGGIVHAQPAGYKDRLAWVRDVINSNELIMIWSEGQSFNNHSIYQRIYNLDLTQPGGTDSTLVRMPLQVDSAITGNKRLAVATGNFLGVLAFHAADSTILFQSRQPGSSATRFNQ